MPRRQSDMCPTPLMGVQHRARSIPSCSAPYSYRHCAGPSSATATQSPARSFPSCQSVDSRAGSADVAARQIGVGRGRAAAEWSRERQAGPDRRRELGLGRINHRGWRGRGPDQGCRGTIGRVQACVSARGPAAAHMAGACCQDRSRHVERQDRRSVFVRNAIDEPCAERRRHATLSCYKAVSKANPALLRAWEREGYAPVRHARD